MVGNVSFGGHPVEPGTKTAIKVPVTTDLNGGPINLTIQVVNGVGEGPTLALLSTLHGSEWLSIEPFRRVVGSLNPQEMKGTLLLVPVGNPVAFQYLTRPTPDESDCPDLNRSFPGKFTWIAEQLAAAIEREVLKKCDYMIDFHWGLWGTSMGTVSAAIDFPDDQVRSQARAMAKAFGFYCIKEAKVCTAFPGPRSSVGYTGGVLGKPAISVEVGGAGFDKQLEEEWIGINVRGITNIMKHLGMIEGEPVLPNRYLLWRNRWRVNPSVGGYLHPLIPPDLGLRRVKKGEVLGKVISPYTFEVLEELRSPGEGIVFYTCRAYPVRPGDWAFGVIDADDPHTRWVDADEV